MGRYLRECDLLNSRYTYTILRGVTSDKKQIYPEFIDKYVRRCQFDRFESGIFVLKKSLAFLGWLNIFMAQLNVGPLS
jgi:hypothetical protein